jgi:hypothetical protein
MLLEVSFVLQFMQIEISVDCSKVLEHMKNQGMPLNENVLNALVRGHIVKGSVILFWISGYVDLNTMC